MFIFMNIWMLGKIFIKQHYLKKKNFIATLFIILYIVNIFY